MTPIAVERRPEPLDKCKHCESTNCLVFNQKEGTRICSTCGCVQEMGVIDQTLEHRNYTSELGGCNSDANRVHQVLGGPRYG